MPLSDDHWNKILKALNYLAIERKESTKDIPTVLALLKEYWDMLGDLRELTDYVNTQELGDKRARRILMVTALETLDTEISEMEKR